MSIYGLSSRRTTIMILARGPTTTGQPGAGKCRQGRRQPAGDLRVPAPSYQAHRPHTRVHRPTVGGNVLFLGTRTAGSCLHRQQTSLLSRALFFSRSLKRLRSGDMCGTAPCTGAEQALGEEKSAPCVLTRGSFNSSPRIGLGRAAPGALAGCRESECEKVSQAQH